MIQIKKLVVLLELETKIIPTKHVYILVPEPFWHLICINFLQLCILCIEFGAMLDKIAVSLMLIQHQNFKN